MLGETELVLRQGLVFSDLAFLAGTALARRKPGRFAKRA
jgi:hypothetical protein